MERRWPKYSLTRSTRFIQVGSRGWTTSTLRSRMGSSWSWSARPGCGKTTALRSIAGLEEISSGTITIGDRIVNDLPPKDRDIAMVFQNYALYPHMTVEQNLAFGLQHAQDGQGRDQAAGHRGGQDARPRAVPEAQARGAVRRPAAAGGDGPGHRPGTAGVPDGRAAVQPGRQAPGVHAGPAHPAARAARRDHRVRDARPGRGHDARAPRLRAPRRAAAAGRHPADTVRPAGEPVRGRLHRLARDELRGRRPDPRRRPRGDLRGPPAAAARLADRGQARAGRLLRPQGDPGRPAVGFRGRAAGRWQLGRGCRCAPMSPRNWAARST